MKSFKLFVFSVATFLFVAALPLQSVQAQGVDDFVVTSFKADYSLTNKDPQGYLEVIETIELDFSGQNRGILRSIPKSYKNFDLNLDIKSVIRDNQPEPYITYDENDNTVIRIGDADKYITGVHSYELIYSLENVISFYDDYDEFYWDINGDQWLQPFEQVNVMLNTKASTKSDIEPQCFAGLFGSDDQSACQLIAQTNGLSAQTTEALVPGETLTVVQAYVKGYFTPPSWFERNGKYIPAAVVFSLQLSTIVWAFKRWNRYGKDHKKRATAPFFGRPKNVSLMQASYLKNNSLTPKHISAAIIDLSIRGYIKIVEQKEGRKTKHILEVIKKPDSDLSEDELMLFDDLFMPNSNANAATRIKKLFYMSQEDILDKKAKEQEKFYKNIVGTQVKLEDKKNKLHQTSQKLANHLDKFLKDNEYYDITPKNAFSHVIAPFVLSLLLGVISFVFADVTNGLSVVAGILTAIIVVTLGVLMTKRSRRGVELVEHMDGLKLYLEKAEKDRIKMQDAVEAPLAPHSGEPTRDVTFFEKLLPFAIAAGVEKSWANAFKDIYTQPPEWYNGNWSTFSTAALASSLSETAKVTSQSFTAPSSSGSSGSGGGGFSGGGGGGGGGGGW